MAFIATLDVVINFDKFRNIDLLSQGLYCVGVSVATENGEIQGMPVALHHSSLHGREGQYTTKAEDNYPKEAICRGERKAYTHSFYIQYLEQVELLDEIVTFRLEAEAVSLLRDDTLHVKMELFHIQRENMEGLEHGLPRNKMPLLESRVIPLHGCGASLTTYIPVAFNEWYFGVVCCSFHTCLIDVTFDPAGIFESKYGNNVGSLEQYLSAHEGLTAHETALSLFRGFSSYLLSCFYDLRALVAEFTPQADPNMLDEPEWLYTDSNETNARPNDGTAPQPNRCRIVSGADKHEVLDPIKSPLDPSRAFAFRPGHSCRSPHSRRAMQARLQEDITPRSSIISLSPSSVVEPRGFARAIAAANAINPTNAASSTQADRPFDDVLKRVDSQRGWTVAATSRIVSRWVDAPLPPSYERVRSKVSYGGEKSDLQLYPFGDKTIMTITGWLVDDLTLEVNDAPVAQLPLLITERLAFVGKQTNRVWNELTQHTMLSPASLFVGLVKVFFRAERSLALRALQPEIPISLPLSASTYFTHPNRSSVTLLELSFNVRREGEKLTALFPEEETHSSTCPLLRALSETIGRAKDKFLEGTHLVVFVHGFRGNRADFRLFRNYMAMFMTKGRMDYLLAQSLEKMPYSNLSDMGEALAGEIQDHILSENIRIRKLSFVAHSMGGVVVRAALRHPFLGQYSKFFETYASFGAPHLGNTTVRSKVVDSAMWVLSTIKNAGCIQELKLNDGFLHSLSCEDKLGKFRNVVLVSCDDDTFVTRDSALVQLSLETACSAAAKDLKAQQVEDMVRNLNQHLSMTERCLRLRITSAEGDTNLGKQTMMERFSGKGHHVTFLCNVSFIVTFLSLYKDFFV
eukprot:GGOE01000514.1.p1 GENE.GGOE01000514.1~~GGOE01000514.1.p1  ORF type:complete len:859 (-),score=234.85 GGOE01000514.1:134-2710(-)